MPVCFTEKIRKPYRKVTEHRIILRGQEIHYQAIAEDHMIPGGDGGEAFSIFTFSYLRMDAGSQRPVIFFFNGGPGGNSTWLHMGFYGPRILKLDENGMPPKGEPYELRDNPECLLDLCDLVAVDPVNAGYSRLFDSRYQKECFDDIPDAVSVSKAIRCWVQKYGRESSVKFFSGESYGSTRASLLGWMLRDLKPIGGAIHIGPGYAAKQDISRNLKDLPPLAATKWYYEKGQKPSLDEWMKECYDFLLGEYLTAWQLGSQCPEPVRQKTAQKLSYFTGLCEEHFLENGLWVSREYFREHFPGAEGKRLGSYDTRFTLPAGSREDPFRAAFEPPIEGCRKRYFEEELLLDPGREYRSSALTDEDSWEWQFTADPGMPGGFLPETPESPKMAGANAMAFRENPGMRFFFGTGRYDSVATIENTRFAVTHTDIPLSSVTMKEYESGHAVYADEVSRKKLAADIRVFLKEALESARSSSLQGQDAPHGGEV